MANSPQKIVEHSGSGFRMPETMARRIDELSKGLPKDFRFCRMAKTPSDLRLEQLPDGSRTDISMITTDDVDRDGEVVIPSGLDLTDFRKSPTVFFSHDYEKPIGRADWLKSVERGIAAKTRYANIPVGWQGPWLPTAVHSLMQEGIAIGKSIGFIPTNAREATTDELRQRPDWKNASRILDKGILLEYSTAALPANQNALALAVSKAVSKGIVSGNVFDLFGIPQPETKDMTDSTSGAAVDDDSLHSHSSTQFDLPDHAVAAVKAMAAKVVDEDLDGDGREAEPHLTLHYGLHTQDAEDVRKAVAGIGPVAAKLGKVAHFPADGNRKTDALHIEAIGQGLHALKKRLTALPHSNSHPDYVPHVTLAYCKPGAAAKYKDMDGVEGMSLTLRNLCFSDRMGNKTIIPLTGEKMPAEPEHKSQEENKPPTGAGVVNEESRPDEVPDEMPPCPKCMKSDHVTKTGKEHDGDGLTYQCSLCQTEFIVRKEGLDTVAIGSPTKEADESETKSGVTVNTACAARARRLIADGKVNHGEWSAPLASQRVQDDCLGSGLSYPIIKGGEVYSRGVAAAESRGADNAPAVAAEAAKLSKLIQSHEGKTFIRPETVRAHCLKEFDAMRPEIVKAVKVAVRERYDRERGRV